MLCIGLVGVGNMGSKHAKVLRMMHEEKKCEFVASCDLIEERASKAVHGINGRKYQNFDNMLKNEYLDGLVIATPTSEHSKMALSAIKKGINVLIEKPVSLRLEDSIKIYEEAKKHDVKVGAGLTEVFNSVVKNLIEMVKKRSLSLNIAIFNRFGFKNSKNDLKDMDVIYDLMIHDIAVIFELLEYPEMSVIGARTLQMNKKSGFYDAATAFLTDGKSNIILNSSRTSEMKVRNFYMDFDELYLQGDYMDQKLNIFSSSKFEFSEALNNLWYNMAFKHYTARYTNNPLYDEDSDFIESIEKGNQPKIGPNKWIKIMRMVDEIENHLFQ